MTKKVSAERLGRWLKDPVTRMYLDAVKDLNNETADRVASGHCIGSKDTTVAEMYHNYMGQLSGIQRCYSPSDLMRQMGYISEGEDDSEV